MTKLTWELFSVIPALPYLGLPSTCQLQEMLMLLGNLEGGWLWPGLPNTPEVSLSLRQFFPFGVVLVNGHRSLSWISHDLETCCHSSHVFWIQMLRSKLSSELRLNHPSFSVNTRTQLPAQLLRYFELKLSSLRYHFTFSSHKEKNIIKKWKVMYCAMSVTLS